jgi:hypothetical protein
MLDRLQLGAAILVLFSCIQGGVPKRCSAALSRASSLHHTISLCACMLVGESLCSNEQDAVETMRTDQETKRELYERITQLEAAAAAAAASSGALGISGLTAAAPASAAGGGLQTSGVDASPPRTPLGSAVPPASPSELGSALAAERQRTTDLQKVV